MEYNRNRIRHVNAPGWVHIVTLCVCLLSLHRPLSAWMLPNVGLKCSEEGMHFIYYNTTTTAIINILKSNAHDTPALDRFQSTTDPTISQCGSSDQFPSAYNLSLTFASCANDAISVTQIADSIIREAIIEVQPDGNEKSIIRRNLNFTQYKIACNFTRQINLSDVSWIGNGTYGIEPVLSLVDLQPTEKPKQQLKMTFYEDSACTKVAVSPLEVTLNEPMYTSIERAEDPAVKLVLKECKMTDHALVEKSTVQYSFAQQGCGLDPTFKLLTENSHKIEFSVNTFLFASLLGEIYMHCDIYLCEKNSQRSECIHAECGHDHDDERKRRSVEEQKERMRRGLEELPKLPTEGATSGLVKYRKKPTCSEMLCQAENSRCVENYPAFCRCLDNHVMDIWLNKCISRNLVRLELPVKMTWIHQYKDTVSKEFFRLANLNQQRMLDYYILETRVGGIRGLKIVSATPDAGHMNLGILMALDDEAIIEDVQNQFQYFQSADDIEDRINVVTSANINITNYVADETAKLAESEFTMSMNETVYLIAIGLGVATFAFIIFVIFEKYKKKHANNDPDHMKIPIDD